MGDEVITGGAKQQPRQGCWLGNNHIILCTPSSSPYTRYASLFLGVDRRNVMILYSFKLKELTSGGPLMH